MNAEAEAVERAMGDLEKELATQFDVHERIAVQHVLERLIDEAPKNPQSSWWNNE